MNHKYVALFLMAFSSVLSANTLKVATFNVSMESTNYNALGLAPSAKVLQQVLSNGENQQVKNIAEIIQRVNPDILLLNEFDYIADQSVGIDNFIKHYLNVSQAGQKAVDYGYVYTNTVNTGEPTNFDLDNNGKKEQYGGDAYGYGLYPGQYGMVVLSKYPIQQANTRTFKLSNGKICLMRNSQFHPLPHQIKRINLGIQKRSGRLFA